MNKICHFFPSLFCTDFDKSNGRDLKEIWLVQVDFDIFNLTKSIKEGNANLCPPAQINDLNIKIIY